MIQSLAKLLGLASHARRPTARLTTKSFRPSMEALETRTVLSTTCSLSYGDTEIMINANGETIYLNIDKGAMATTLDDKVVVTTGKGEKWSFDRWSFTRNGRKEVQHIYYTGGALDDWFQNNTDIDSNAKGRGGNDVLIGGSGDDELNGGDGDDKLYGREGGDWLAGDFIDHGVHSRKVRPGRRQADKLGGRRVPESQAGLCHEVPLQLEIRDGNPGIATIP